MEKIIKRCDIGNVVTVAFVFEDAGCSYTSCNCYIDSVTVDREVYRVPFLESLSLSKREISRKMDSAIEYRMNSIVMLLDANSITVNDHTMIRVSRFQDDVIKVEVLEKNSYEYAPVMTVYLDTDYCDVNDNSDRTIHVEAHKLGKETYDVAILSYDSGKHIERVKTLTTSNNY